MLYSGDQKWNAATHLQDLLNDTASFKSYMPSFQYFKIAENEYKQDQLLEIGNIVSTLFLAETADEIDI